MIEKSLTGRTVATLTVEDDGTTTFTYVRNGMTVQTFNDGREQDLPKSAELRKEKGHVLIIDRETGIEVGRVDIV